MWGYIFGENNLFQNFTFGFPNQNSDILLHLTHWQYWFWFWFTYLFVLYYILLFRVLKNNKLLFKPKLVTSLRTHGKWGDILVCLLPISWCLNILSNSSAILRLIEWQTETPVFTLRVRGKQWYWVYKFELKNYKLLNEIRKKLGISHWLKTSFDWSLAYLFIMRSLKTTDDNVYTWYTLLFEYYELFQGESKNNFNKPSSLKKNLIFKTKFNKNLYSKFNLEFFNSKNNFNLLEDLNEDFKDVSFLPIVLTKEYNSLLSSFVELYKDNITIHYTKSGKIYTFDNNNFKNIEPLVPFYSFLTKSKAFDYVETITREVKQKTHNVLLSVSVKDYKINPNYSYNQIHHIKYQPICIFLVVKQKRVVLDHHHIDPEKRYLTDSQIFDYFYTDKDYDENGDLILSSHKTVIDNIYNFYKKKFTINTSLNKRLLRTKRILVLPSHLRIGLITNSFDVVHSWYIPGLGVKLDCVPGRSTHHTLFIDHVGFYYGQCAEICGRFHHHMPIRICALPLKEFLTWWYNYGVPYFVPVVKKDRLIFSKKFIDEVSW